MILLPCSTLPRYNCIPFDPPLFHLLVISQLQTCWLPPLSEKHRGGCPHRSHELLKVESCIHHIRCFSHVKHVLYLDVREWNHSLCSEASWSTECCFCCFLTSTAFSFRLDVLCLHVCFSFLLWCCRISTSLPDNREG